MVKLWFESISDLFMRRNQQTYWFWVTIIIGFLGLFTSYAQYFPVEAFSRTQRFTKSKLNFSHKTIFILQMNSNNFLVWKYFLIFKVAIFAIINCVVHSSVLPLPAISTFYLLQPGPHHAYSCDGASVVLWFCSENALHATKRRWSSKCIIRPEVGKPCFRISWEIVIQVSFYVSFEWSLLHAKTTGPVSGAAVAFPMKLYYQITRNFGTDTENYLFL